MSESPPTIQLTREEAIEKLRNHLLTLCDDEHSICQIAAEKKIFCRGFAHFSAEEMRKEYKWLEEKEQRNLTRPELEEKANQWVLARELLHGVSIACDAQMLDRDQCSGWDDFSNEKLAEYHRELLGEPVEIVDSHE